MKIQIKNGVDNIFECLPDSITTVNVILDSINFNLKEFSFKTENIVKNLNYTHAENDDFFDTDTNTVLNEDEICKVYDLEIV